MLIALKDIELRCSRGVFNSVFTNEKVGNTSVLEYCPAT